MLSPNRLLISKLSCLNYTFIQLFTCQTFIWPTKHLCLTSDLQKNLNEIFRATTREQPLNRRISGWWYIRFSGTFFLCRKPLILHLQECDGSILCYYETILQVRGKVYFQSEVLAHQHTLRQRWRSELRTHTHTHTVDISRPNESADSRHVSVSDTHTAGFVSCSSWSTKTLIFKKLKSIPNFGLLSCVVDAGRRFKAESDLFSHRLRLRRKSFLTAAGWTQERKTISLHVEFCSTCWKPVNQCEDCEDFLCLNHSRVSVSVVRNSLFTDNSFLHRAPEHM